MRSSKYPKDPKEVSDQNYLSEIGKLFTRVTVSRQVKLEGLLKDRLSPDVNINKPFPLIFKALFYRYNLSLTEKHRVHPDNMRIVKLFLEHPQFNPNKFSTVGETALTMACDKNDLELVNALLTHDKINPNLMDKKGCSPLCYAVKNGNLELVNALLAHDKIDPNLTDNNGYSSLYYAVKNGNVEIVKALLKKNANANATFNGKTLWEIAKNNNHKDLMKILAKPSLYRRLFPKKSYQQTWLTDRMMNLGYNLNDSGVCYGIAHMGMQAFLISGKTSTDIGKFYDRLDRISAITPEEIQNVVNRANQKRIEIVKKVKDKVSDYNEDEVRAQIKSIRPDYVFIDAPVDDAERRKFEEERRKFLIDAMIEDQIAKKLTREEQIDLDIPVFFEGVELYQQAFRYKELFKKGAELSFQSGTLIAPLVTSQELSAQGGIANIDGFSGVYNHNDLIAYFQGLKDALDDEPAFNHPVSLVLSDMNHTISIGYDPKSKSFILFDGNYLKEYKDKLLGSAEDIARIVEDSFKSKNLTIMTSEVFVAANHRKELQGRLDKWKSTITFQTLHQVTDEKAKKRDNNNGSWAQSAAIGGETKLITDLMAKDAGPIGFLKRNWKPLLIGGLITAAVITTGIFTFGTVPLIMSIGAGITAGVTAVSTGAVAIARHRSYISRAKAFISRAKEVAINREKSLNDILEQEKAMKEKPEISAQHREATRPEKNGIMSTGRLFSKFETKFCLDVGNVAGDTLPVVELPNSKPNPETGKSIEGDPILEMHTTKSNNSESSKDIRAEFAGDESVDESGDDKNETPILVNPPRLA